MPSIRSLGLTGLVLISLALVACSKTPDARPSVVLVVIDTLRRDHLSWYGYPKETSPHLARWAASSAVFDRCLAPSSWTQPSTVSLHTGLYPARHGAHSYAQVDTEVRFLAEELKAAGYATGGFSGNPNASPLFAMDQGFDHFWFPGNELAREYPDVTEILAEAREWLDTQDGPVFLYLHVMNVHGPYLAPPEYRERFLPEEWQEFPFRNETWTSIMVDGDLEARQQVTPAHLADLVARYDGAIAYTDEMLGGFLDGLEADGMLDRSLLVVASDHGEELFDHGGFGHGWTLHGEVVDVPLMLREPGGGTAQRIDTPVSLVDLPATLLDAVGRLETGPGGTFGDGRSLLPLLRGEEPTPRPLLSQVQRKQNAAFALELWPVRLIEVERGYLGEDPHALLFNVRTDPGEQTDLTGEREALVEDLREEAQALRTRLESDRFASTPVELDEEWRKRLGALGYGQSP